MRKFLSVLLAMAMVLSLTVTSFAADTAADAKAEMAGKTVILHTNDVHGAVEGYAYIAQLKADYEAKGAEVILVDAGDFSQGTTYVSSTKGADAVTMMNAAGYGNRGVQQPVCAHPLRRGGGGGGVHPLPAGGPERRGYHQPGPE